MGITGRSIAQPEYTTQKNHLLHSSLVDGQAYSWANVTYDAAANDTILLVKNTSTTHNLHIDQIWCHGDTTTTVAVFWASGVTPAGTTVTGVNLNTTSSNTAEATAKGDETGNSGGSNVWVGSIPADNATPVLISSGLILASGYSIGVDYATDGGEALVTIIGHYENT